MSPTILTDKNRLSLVYPKIAKEWNCDKNQNLKSSDICYASNKKVWWKCKIGHEYDMRVCDRTRGGNCPYCSGRRLSDKNRLSVTNPELCEEWYYIKNKSLKPEDISCGSTKKVWWKCKKCQWEWNSSCSSRHYGNGCPRCAGKVVSKDRCLLKVNPKISKEWNYKRNVKTPKDVMPNSDLFYWWICSKGHEWKSNISNRNHGNGCPYCSGQKICKDNCLGAINPKLSKEWHSIKNGKLLPKDVLPNTNKKAWWECSRCGYEWCATIQSRNLQGRGCPACSKIKLKDGTLFDSLPEAYVYLKLKNKGFLIEQNKRYGFGKYNCDFYLPQINTYVEVTSYHKNSTGFAKRIWKKYYHKILKKKSYTEDKLGAQFRFMQIRMNRYQIVYVRSNMF